CEYGCFAVVPALPSYPDVSVGVSGGSRIHVRSGGIGDPYSSTGFPVLHDASPDVEIRLGVCGPEHPRPALPVDGDSWPIEISSGRGDSDRFTPRAIRVTLQKNLVATGWGG